MRTFPIKLEDDLHAALVRKAHQCETSLHRLILDLLKSLVKEPKQ